VAWKEVTERNDEREINKWIKKERWRGRERDGNVARGACKDIS
jgi:hypothetical protein